ncbi:glutamate--tRNA ligase [Candidatus Pacearchaeota archaeon]|nr:glutamate--tRNA ligase [Candidatus Pacearchaeota archaeon]
MVDKKHIRAYALKNALEHDGKAVVGSVIAGLFNHGLQKSQIKEIMPKIQDVLKEINSMSGQELEQEFAKLESLIGHRVERDGLAELPGVKKGSVNTRMSPSPSGPLTLGHILTIGPNYLYTKKYGGTFFIRIEDTNPENIDPKAYKMIKEESKWLCDGNVKIVIQSERMDLYYKYAQKFIDKGAAYVCTCDVDAFKDLLLKKTGCPCRSLDKKEQKKRWKNMLDKDGYKQGEAVLRFKSDITHKNPAMRDFPLARINTTPHPKQKKKYRVWPLMNLAVPVDDIEMKMTHIIRGKDHMDNSKRQKMMYKALGKEKQYPWVAFIGRLHFTDFVMSTSKMRKAIEEGKYSGWDDPKLPTVVSLKNKGYCPEAFWKYVEQRGVSETDKTISQKDFFQLIDNFEKDLKRDK